MCGYFSYLFKTGTSFLRIFSLLLLLLSTGEAFSQTDSEKIRLGVLAEAKKLTGTVEASGKNDGPVVEKILNSVGLRRGDPYCAAFNYWCYLQSGGAKYVPCSGWSPDWVKSPTWTRFSGGRTPEPGDAFGIYFKSRNRVAHTGLVKKWGNTAVITFEGNTSQDAAPGSAADRDGGGIWSKRRLISQIYSVRNWLD